MASEPPSSSPPGQLIRSRSHTATSSLPGGGSQVIETKEEERKVQQPDGSFSTLSLTVITTSTVGVAPAASSAVPPNSPSAPASASSSKSSGPAPTPAPSAQNISPLGFSQSLDKSSPNSPANDSSKDDNAKPQNANQSSIPSGLFAPVDSTVNPPQNAETSGTFPSTQQAAVEDGSTEAAPASHHPPFEIILPIVGCVALALIAGLILWIHRRKKNREERGSVGAGAFRSGGGF